MATITFSNGTKVNFNGTPTQKDIDEIAAKIASSTPQQNTKPQPEATGVLGAVNAVAKPVGDFLGVTNFGKGLGVAMAQGSKDVKNQQKSLEHLQQVTNTLLEHALALPPASDRRKELLKLVQENEKMIGNLSDTSVKDAPTNAQFLSGAANTAINIVGAGSLGTKSAGAGVLGTTKYAAAPLATEVAQSAGQAGAMTISNKLGEGKSVKDSVVAAIGPAALAGGLTLGTGLIARAITKKLSGAPEAIYKKTVNQSMEDTKKEVLRGATSEAMGKQDDASRNFAKTLLAENVKGGRKNLLKTAITQVDDIGKRIDQIVGAQGELGVTDKAGKLLDGPQYKLYGEAGQRAEMSAARASEARVAPIIKTEKYREFFDELLQKQGPAIDDADQELLHRAAVGDLNIKDGLELRIFLDEVTPKGGFATDPSVAVASRALTKASGDLRQQIAAWSNKYDPNLQKLINKQSVYIRLRDEMVQTIASEVRAKPNISVYGLMNGISRGVIFNPALTTRVAQALKATNTALEKTSGLRGAARSAIISGSVNAPK